MLVEKSQGQLASAWRPDTGRILASAYVGVGHSSFGHVDLRREGEWSRKNVGRECRYREDQPKTTRPLILHCELTFSQIWQKPSVRLKLERVESGQSHVPQFSHEVARKVNQIRDESVHGTPHWWRPEYTVGKGH